MVGDGRKLMSMKTTVAKAIIAKGLAGWLIGRRSLSLGYPRTDPRYGMLPGDDEADNYNRLYYHQDTSLHFYSSTAEFYRAAVEMFSYSQKICADQVSKYQHLD